MSPLRKKIALSGFAGLLIGAVTVYLVGNTGVWVDDALNALGGGSKAADAERQNSGVPVQLATARRDQIADTFKTNATVTAAKSVTLTSTVASKIESIAVSDGQRLHVGDIILRFEDDRQQRLVSAKVAALKTAEAELARAVKLFEDGFSTAQRLENAETSRRQAKAELRAAQEELDDRIVRAPFSGQIGFVKPNIGAFLSPGDAIAELETTNQIRLRFSLPMSILSNAADIGPVTFLADTDDCVVGKIVAASPIVDLTTRTREYEATLPPKCKLSPGEFLEIDVQISKKREALVVPQTAVMRSGFENYVFKIAQQDDDRIARRTPVELGHFQGDAIAITSGLKPGDQVVSSGLQKIEDGSQVMVAKMPKP